MPHDVAGAIETLHSSIVIYIMDMTRGLSSRRVVLAFSVGVSGEGRVLRLVCIGQQSLLGGVADGSSDRFWRLDVTLVSTLWLIYHSVHIHTSIYQRLCDVVGRRVSDSIIAGDREETLLLRPRGPHHGYSHNTST